MYVYMSLHMYMCICVCYTESAYLSSTFINKHLMHPFLSCVLLLQLKSKVPMLYVCTPPINHYPSLSLIL